LGTTWAKLLWKNVESIPRSAYRSGLGSGGRAAATSTRDRMSPAFRPNCDRTRSIWYLASTVLSESACGAEASGARNPDAV
jgi:hypothetical protein